MKVVLILRALTSEELTKVKELTADGWQLRSDQVYEQLQGLSSTLIDNYSKIKQSVSTELIKQVCEFPNSAKGQELINKLSLNNFHLWYYHRFRLFFALEQEWILSRLIASITSDELLVFSNVGVGNNVPSPAELVLPPKGDQVSKSKWLGYLFVLFWRWLLQSGKPKKDHSVIFLNHALMENFIYDEQKRKAVVDNTYLGSYLERTKGELYVMDEVPTPVAGKLSNKKRYWKYPYPDRDVLYSERILVNGLLRSKIRSTVRKTSEHWSVYLKEQVGNNAEPDFVKDVSRLLLSYGPATKDYLIRYHSFIKFFKKHKQFKLIATIGEQDSIRKAILDAARFSNIKTVGIQHGTIYDNHISYTYSAEELKYQPAPDHMLVWGEKWKENLIKFGNYSDSAIEVVGQLRTDVIPQLLKENNNDHGLFKVIFASQPMPIFQDRIDVLRAVLKAASKFPQLELIIRPHPRETDDLFFNRIAKEEGVTSYSIERKEGLYQTMAKSNALITCFSSVAYEALYFDLPILIFDPRSEDRLSMIKNELCFHVTDEISLTKVFNELMTHQPHVPSSSVKEFTKTYTHLVDGNVVNRIKKFTEDQVS
jgi:hypothetical protein